MPSFSVKVRRFCFWPVVVAGDASKRHTDIRASHMLTCLAWLEHDEYSWERVFLDFYMFYIGSHKWCDCVLAVAIAQRKLGLHVAAGYNVAAVGVI